jgi:cell division protein FtsQ
VTAFREHWARWWPRVTLGTAAVVVLSSPWWGRALARQLAYFRVRRVEIVGTRYLAPSDVLGRLKADTTMSIWDDPTPLERRVARHPQVRGVTIERRLPATLVVRIDEVLPIALAPGAGGLRAFDAAGRELPFDPSRSPVDLPIASQRDTALFRLLDDLRRSRPALYARVSDIERTGPREVRMHVASLTVRAMVDVTADRLAEIFPVEADLARRQARVAELDLRYRDQVIARLP